MTDESDASVDAARLRADLAAVTDEELTEVSSPAATGLCTADVPLGDLFPTLANRRYLTMPVRLLPTRMHGPFGKKPWRWLVQRTPAELTGFGRVTTADVGALLASLRTETAVVEEQAG